ncbi:hypothetical protein [Sphingomonas sp. PR090111-T3T-6A]|uniref:hypothetical protein n=1 Tax=Sphingomonas sp. PR090111-T3T-6A TaxID=685778 RepID=UPI00036CD7F6|nr:hypothetical protein [Sphingomonas sp. PR090111-T3T-6A]
MSITIRGGRGGHIRIIGDVETVLIAPYARRGLPFVLAFSDGSLIEGSYDAASDRHDFHTLIEGAGILSVERTEGGPIAVLDWSIEWATIAPMSGMISRDQGLVSALDGVQVAAMSDENTHVGSVVDWLRRGPLKALDPTLLPLS